MEVNKYQLGAVPLDVSFIKDSIERSRVRSALRVLELGIASMFSLKGVYDDMIRCRKVVDIYPKKRRPIPHSDYLHLVWVLFITLCYLLEERAKLFGNRFNAIVDVYNVGKKIDVGTLVRKIQYELKDQIRARGELMHEALPGHKRIVEYAMLELLHRVGPWPKEFPKYERIHGMTKVLLDLEMRSATAKAKSIVAEALSVAANDTAEAVMKFNDFYEQLRSRSGSA